ncbi:MAG: hypothetical protein K2J67_01480, partial [Lachnospiraceae bacterium]|nr:hypothetical protein [Lachnospiraceae bacterium]
SIMEAQNQTASFHGAADALYTQAFNTLRSQLEKFQEQEAYCILCLLANIDDAERAAGIPDHIFSQIKPDIQWINSFYQQIKFHIWQLQYPFPADIQYESRQYLQTHLSEVALQYFWKLSKPV